MKIKPAKMATSFVLIIAVLLVAVLSASIIYVWQQSVLKKTTKLFAYRLDNLQKELTLAQQISEDQDQQIKPTQTSERKITVQAKGLSSQEAKNVISQKVEQVIFVLDQIAQDPQKNLALLVPYIHPDKGLRFSPYAYVNEQPAKTEVKQAEGDVTFMAAALNRLNVLNEKIFWGQYDGSGEPIELNFNDYYYKFIYDRYYAKTDLVYYNESISSGNTINNAFEFYPDSIIVEYYFDGQNPQVNGLDWAALRLVFMAKEGNWYLVGIIHDQWTI